MIMLNNFIARMGYILTWGFGIPEYNLEEKFEEYYIVGLLITIMGIVAMVFLMGLFVWYLKKRNEVSQWLQYLYYGAYCEFQVNAVD